MNPYEMQRRMVKACALADKAEELGFLPDELANEHPKARQTLAKMCGVKPPSVETWDMAVELLGKRTKYEGSGGIDSPKFIQHLGAMAVQITETLAKNNLDSFEATQLSKSDKRRVAKISKANDDETTFNLGQKFLEMREEHRSPITKDD
tara:strand:+ start:476 stop:925 length:450 start_codon:yes stop_codon:yes gene_type:complete